MHSYQKPQGLQTRKWQGMAKPDDEANFRSGKCQYSKSSVTKSKANELINIKIFYLRSDSNLTFATLWYGNLWLIAYLYKFWKWKRCDIEWHFSGIFSYSYSGLYGLKYLKVETHSRNLSGLDTPIGGSQKQPMEVFCKLSVLQLTGS